MRLKFLFVAVAAVIGCCYVLFAEPEAESPKAVEGFLDAAAFDFESGRLLKLDGDWELYWSELLPPDSFRAGNPPKPVYYPVPNTWKRETFANVPMSNFGYATYRLTVRLDESVAGRTLGVYMPSVATSYRLWIDGRFRAENGTVGDRPEEMVPKNYRKVVVFEPSGSEVELIVQVANFVQRKGGLWESIRIGTEERVAYERDKSVAVQMLVIGSLFFMGIYHFGLYFFRTKDRAPLFFGAACISIAVRTLLLGETLLVRFFREIPWEVAVKFEYWSTTFTVPFFLLYCYYQYPMEIRRTWARGAFLLVVVYNLAVLALPAKVYTHFMPYYSVFALAAFLYIVYGFGAAAIRGREGAGWNFAALTVFLGTILNDILFYNHIVHTNEMVSYGLFFYLFVQSVLLATKFSRAFIRSERLSEQLTDLNETLETKIEERTRELHHSNVKLQEANERLKREEQARRSLLSNISHELRTPLTAIRGYCKAMLDGIVKERPEKYLSLIDAKVELMDRLFRDLLELSRLEARKAAFHIERIPADVLVHLLYDKYEWDVRSKGLKVELSETIVAPDGFAAVVDTDVVRAEQVFANFMMNAKKYTPEGGRVAVHAELRREGASDWLWVSVTDSGPGIPKEEAERVFERFYQGEGARSAPAGLGLGLAISKEIVETLGGSIGVASEAGEGSTFYFNLPIRFDREEEVS